MTVEKYEPCHATVRYSCGVGAAHVNFEAFQWYGLPHEDQPEPTYRCRRAGEYGSQTENLDEAFRYFTGCVNWDGCTNIDFHPEGVAAHLCGGGDMKKFAVLVCTIFVKCRLILGGLADDKCFEIEEFAT